MILASGYQAVAHLREKGANRVRNPWVRRLKGSNLTAPEPPLYPVLLRIQSRVHLHPLEAFRIADLFAEGATPAEVNKQTRTNLLTLMRYARPTNDQVLSSFDKYSSGYV